MMTSSLFVRPSVEKWSVNCDEQTEILQSTR